MSLRTIYIGCDGRYFELYAEIFVASLNINAPGQKLFFSICNPLSNFTERLLQLKKLATTVTIGHEVYIKDLSDKSDAEKPGFYASHRFVQLNEYFKEHQENILFVDIDSIIRNDLNGIDDIFADCDVALRLRLYEKRERVRVLAACIFIRYNERSLYFTQKLSDALLGQYEWYKDQEEIYKLLKNDTSIKVSNFESAYLDWEFADSALIWCGKGTRKTLDDKYIAYTEWLLSEFRQGHLKTIDHFSAQKKVHLNRAPVVNLRRPYRLIKAFNKIFKIIGLKIQE